MGMKMYQRLGVVGISLLVITIGGCGDGNEPGGGGTSDPTPAAQQDPAAQPEPSEPATPAVKPVASDPFLKLESASAPAAEFPTIETKTCVLTIARVPQQNRGGLEIATYNPMNTPANMADYPQVMFQCELTTSGSIDESAGRELEGVLFVMHEKNGPVWRSMDEAPAKLTFAPIEPASMLEAMKIQGTIRATIYSPGKKKMMVTGEFLAEDAQ